MKALHSSDLPPVAWRLWVIIFFLIIIFLALIGRLIYLTIFNRSFLIKQGQARTLRIEDIPAFRGIITDRNGQPLAVSTPVDSIWINPNLFHPDAAELRELARALQMPVENIRQQMLKDHSFVYLKRSIAPDLATQVMGLKIEGLYTQRSYKRYYPEGEVTAHLVGLTDVDDHGQEGLELAFDNWLSGVTGKKQVIKDRLGQIISEVALLKKPELGKPLALSIDQRIQYSAYQALKAAMAETQAASGSVVVLDARTSEVLAVVNQPSYNPNSRPAEHDGRYRNRALTDVFEPGSTIKPFTLALALQSGKYSMASIIDTCPGSMRIGGYTISDDEACGVLNLKQILEKSSNIGAAKIMLSLSPEEHWRLLHELGFGSLTGSNFPGEVPGRLIEQSIWRPSVVATMAYGYGMSITALQLAHAYTVFANNGNLYPLSLLKLDKPLEANPVIAPNVVQQMVPMLEDVVQNGTGKRAQITGYRVGGKTGTAYIATPTGYDRHRYVSSFVGVAPLDNPRLVIAVVIREPKGPHMGATVSAPVFAAVMSDALRILGVSPHST